MAVKTRNIINFQRQLDAAFPGRDKPDGWIGDADHRGRTSGHNPDDTPGAKPAWNGDPDTTSEVRDLDVRSDLGGGFDGRDLVGHLVKVSRIGTVFRYFIHRGRIYHQRNGFVGVAFDGDPHNDHVHCEGAWTQAADNNGSFDFRLEELTMPSPSEYAAEVIKRLDDAPIRNSADIDPKTKKPKDSRTMGGTLDAVVVRVVDTHAKVADIEAKVDALTKAVAALAARI